MAMPDPRKHDEAEAALFDALAKAEQRLSYHIDQMHSLVNDRKDYQGNRSVWRMTHAQVIDQLKAAVATGDKRNLTYQVTPSEVLTREGELRTESAKIQVEIEKAEAIYREHRWTRWFPCLNRDGHIHSSLRGCPSVRWDTQMGWTPELSGKSIETAVAELGEALCTICFPAAPVEWQAKTLGQVKDERTRAEREAAKAAKDAVKNVKRLAAAEVFRTRYHRDPVETVAACKDLIRKPIETAAELAWYRSPAAGAKWQGNLDARDNVIRNVTDFLAQQEEDAEQAKRVLLAREARHEGWGATQAQIDKIIASKTKAAAKAWA